MKTEFSCSLMNDLNIENLYPKYMNIFKDITTSLSMVISIWYFIISNDCQEQVRSISSVLARRHFNWSELSFWFIQPKTQTFFKEKNVF